MATPSIIQTDPKLERRRQLALAMMQQGQNSAPVQHWTQGANRVAQSLLGAYQARQAEQQQQEQQQMGQEALAQAMQQLQGPSQPMTAGQPGDEMAFDLGQPKSDASAIQRFAQTLAANPYTSEYGSNLAVQDALQEQKLKQTLADPRYIPSSIRELQMYQNMTPEQQRQLLLLKRKGTERIGDQLYDTSQGQPRALLTPEQQLQQGAIQAQVKGGVSQAQAAGTAQGKLNVERRANLPQAMANAESGIALIDQALNHPGLGYAVGKSSMLPVIPGTDAADFMAILDQLQGQNFLQAFESLKGGGQITEVEGRKAEQAISRLQRSQSEQGFKNSLIELKNLIRTGAERAQAGITVDDPYTGNFSAAKQEMEGRRSGRSDLRQPAEQGPPPGYQLMIDANGNRAYVGPNGEIQELP